MGRGASLVLMRNAEQEGEWVVGEMGVWEGVMSEVGMERERSDGGFWMCCICLNCEDSRCELAFWDNIDSTFTP
jgi:hypothetical protein